MPDGRFLSKSIAYSAQLASVSFEADYLFTHLIPFCDREGRLPGEPLAIKGMCCPLREQLSPGIIETCLGELRDAGLLVWYQVGAAQFVQLPGFGKHQRGARLEREAPSRLPGPEDEGAEEVRPTPPNSGQLRQSPPKSGKRRVSKGKRSEVKGSKAKGSEEAPDADAPAGGRDTKKRETWITPFAEVWKDLYGGSMPIEPNLRPLKNAVESLGADEALRRWENYLSATPGRYANGARFAATLNDWASPNGARQLTSATVPVTDIALARARVLYQLGSDHGLLAFAGNRREYSAALKKAGADSRAGESFDDDFKASRMWEGLGALSADVAVREIARRLELARASVQPEAAKSA